MLERLVLHWKMTQQEQTIIIMMMSIQRATMSKLVIDQSLVELSL